jgi:TPR repeat protein
MKYAMNARSPHDWSPSAFLPAEDRAFCRPGPFFLVVLSYRRAYGTPRYFVRVHLRGYHERVFSEFLCDLKGTPIHITASNCEDLFDLTAELGCRALASRVQRFIANSSRELLRALVDSGSAESQYCAGICLLGGQFCQNDPERALIYLKRSGSAGHSDAQSEYRRWVGLDQNELEFSESDGSSVFWRDASGCGCLPSLGSIFKSPRFFVLMVLMVMIAVILMTVRISAVKGFLCTMYRLWAHQGNFYNQWLYGLCLEHGMGVDIDLIEAVKYYRRLADRGDSNGQLIYGVCREHGIGIDVNLVEAVNYYRLSADQGNSYGQLRSGMCLEHGKGVAVNLAEAVKYYRLSANQGNSGGQWRYGVCLEYGLGIDIDLAEAVKYYRLSAARGNSEGQLHYGLCLEYGKGVEVNFVKAVKYYCLSAARGNSEGQRRLSFLLPRVSSKA